MRAEEPSWGSKTWNPQEDLGNEERESELEVIENTPFQSDPLLERKGDGNPWFSMQTQALPVLAQKTYANEEIVNTWTT